MTKTIVLAVSGSISAYKAADLSNQLTKLGYQVHILMTEAATQFIAPLTLQVLSKNPVHLDVMKEDDPKVVNHIELAKQADLFVVAPASANTIAKLAHGIADNIVTATAPAMNTKMYDNPLTQRNLQILQEVGYQEIEPRSSMLACGDVGRGALAELDAIIQKIQDTIEN